MAQAASCSTLSSPFVQRHCPSRRRSALTSTVAAGENGLVMASSAPSPAGQSPATRQRLPRPSCRFLSHSTPAPCTRHVSARSSAAQQQQSSDADVMGLLLRQRIVFLGAELNDFVADAVVSQLLLLDAQDPQRDIRLFINSPGGSISATMAVFDAINLCRADVSTIAFGLVASTASILLAGGTRGKRLAMPNTRIMVHQPMGGASGQAIDVEIQAKEIMYHKDNITRILSQITGRPFEKVEKDIDRDRYMSPMEAVEYGLIDGVIDEDAIIPLQPTPDRVKPRSEYLDAGKDPRRFLIPTIPDSEIF